MEDQSLVAEYKMKLESAEVLVMEYKRRLQTAEGLIAEKDLELKKKNDYNSSLEETIHQLEKKNFQLQNDDTTDLETLKQQNYSLQKKLEVQVALVKSMVSEAESMREKMVQEEEKIARGEELQKQKAVLEVKLEESIQQIVDLELEVADLKMKVNEGGGCPVAREHSVHEVSGYLDQITMLTNEISDLKEKNNQANRKLGAMEEELKGYQNRVKLLENSEEELRTAADIYKQQSAEYREHLQESKEDCMELRAELEGLKAAAGGGFSEKGNSLFSEVDDERKRLHDHILKQNESYQAMKQKCQTKDDAIARYKMKLAAALSLNATSHGDKQYIQQLKDRLSKSVTQVKSLTQRLEERETETPDSDNKQGINSIVKTWRIEKSQLEKELRSSRLNYLMASDKMLEVEFKLKQSEETCRQLRGDIIRLNIKLEEKRKQTEDVSPITVTRKGITEKIPDTPKEEFILRENCSRPEKVKIEAKENVATTKHGYDSDEVLADNYGSSPKLKKKQKKVAIAETVELQYDCGRKDSGLVSEEEKQPLKRRVKGRKVDFSAKQISNQVPDECKQQ